MLLILVITLLPINIIVLVNNLIKQRSVTCSKIIFDRIKLKSLLILKTKTAKSIQTYTEVFSKYS